MYQLAVTLGKRLLFAMQGCGEGEDKELKAAFFICPPSEAEYLLYSQRAFYFHTIREFLYILTYL